MARIQVNNRVWAASTDYDVPGIWLNSNHSADDIYALEFKLPELPDYVCIKVNGIVYYSQYICNDSVRQKWTSNHYAKAYSIRPLPLKEYETHHWFDETTSELKRELHIAWHKYLFAHPERNTPQDYKIWLKMTHNYYE